MIETADDDYKLDPSSIGKMFMMEPHGRLWKVHTVYPDKVLCVLYGKNEGVFLPHYEVVLMVDEYEEDMHSRMFY